MSAPAVSQSRPESATPLLPALFMQVSVAASLVLFVRDLLQLAPLDHALLTAGGVGCVLYFALVGGSLLVRRILDAPAEPETPAPAEGEADEAAAASETPADAPVA